MSHHLARRVAVVLALAAAGCDGPQQQAAPQAPPPAVGVMVAAKKPIATGTDFTGRVDAVDKVELRGRVQGFLEQRAFTEGQDVKEGDLLFVIEKGPYIADVDQKKAAVAHAQAELKNATLQLERGRELLKQQQHPQGDGRRARGGRGDGAGQRASGEGGLAGGRRSTSATPRSVADRRADRPGGIHRRQSRRPGVQPAGDDRQSGSGLCHVPVSQRQLLEVRKRQVTGEKAKRKSCVQLAPDGTLYPHPGKFNFLDVKVDRGPTRSRCGRSSRIRTACWCPASSPRSDRSARSRKRRW